MSVMASSRAALHSLFIAWFVVSTVLLQPTDGYGYGFPWKWRKHPRPCWNKVFYFHDILYNGKNSKNATSAIVAAPDGANRTVLTGKNHFGDLVVFDDPITLDNNLQSHPVGRAQGFYFYDMKNTLSSWLGFTFVLNSTDHRGTITFTGANPILTRYRDISVVGGTGDFILARGIATISTDAIQGNVYFRLRVNITLYECYHCLYSLSVSADDSASQNGKSKSVLA